MIMPAADVVNRCSLNDADRRFPGKHMYCKKHNYGPMDTWYDCNACCSETVDEFEAYRESDEYKEGQRLIRRGAYAEGIPMTICPSRRKTLRYHKMSTILKKIPQEDAAEWITHFVSRA